MKNNKAAFTLIELLVVIAIIGILSTLAVVSLQGARSKARDAKRITDIRQMQMALELYLNDWGEYPDAVVGGGEIGNGTDTYMMVVPSSPTPADIPCTAATNPYKYQRSADKQSYDLQFCLSGKVGSLEALGTGIKCASPGGVVSTTSVKCF